MDKLDTELKVLAYLGEHKMSLLGPIVKELHVPRIQLILLMVQLDREGKIEIGRAFNKCHNSIYFATGEIDKMKQFILECFKEKPKSLLSDIKAIIYRKYPITVSSFINQLISSYISSEDVIFEKIGSAKMYSFNYGKTDFYKALPRVRRFSAKSYSGLSSATKARLDSARGYLTVPYMADEYARA